jgi:hypothetical protein
VVPLVALTLGAACNCDPEVTRFECGFEVTPSGEGNAIEFNATAIGES